MPAEIAKRSVFEGNFQPVASSLPWQSFLASLDDDVPLSELDLKHPCSYRGWTELWRSWNKLESARVEKLGESVEGRPIWGFALGNPDARKMSVVLGGIHPIEWIGIETAFALACEHGAAPCSDRQILFVPMMNPDGFVRVESKVRAGKRGWVRANANNVDLNRNWPTHFKKSRGLIAGHNASGPSPLSEPEVACVVGALDALQKNTEIDVALSLHSIGKMILMPWGGVWRRPETRPDHLRAAKALRSRLPGYTVRQVSHWVPGISFAHGMEIDHLHKAYGATSILVECTRGELSWKRPHVLFHPFRMFNPRDGREQAAGLAQALDPFVRGLYA